MKTTVDKQLQTAKEYLIQKDFNLAIEKLNKVELDNISSSLLGDYYLLKSECLLNLGNFNHSYPESAISFFKKTSSHSQYAFAKYLKGWQLQSLGETIQAKGHLIEAYSAALRADDYILAGKSLSKLSYILQKSGDIDQAIENIIKCIEIDIELEEYSKAEKMKNNLARLYISIGRFNKAISRFNNSDINNINTDPNSIISVALSHSIALAYCGDFDKAFDTLKKHENIPEQYDRLRVIYHEYYGHILMLDGQLKESLSQLHTGLKLSIEMAPESDMISQIERLLGDAYLLKSDYTNAFAHTAKALVVAERVNERIEIAACHRIFAQIDYHKKNNDKAKENFDKAFTIFEKIKSNYELAVTRYLAATTSLYTDEQKFSMLYLAQEYFDSEDIKHYAQKVETALLKLKNSSVKIKPLQANKKFECPTIITATPKMLELLELSKLYAPTNDTVLITGATGTGKELIAEHLHYHSGRTGKFVAINTAAIPESMVESELFGYEKGAFTGAVKTKPGKFELAQGGTLFLDEIGDMPLLLQAKLLRIIENKKVERLGAVSEIDLDIRVIAATNKDLETLSKQNKFRTDLFYRLNILRLDLLSLKERPADFYPLVEYFLTMHKVHINGDANVVKQIASILSEKKWVGNIRQLQGEVRRLAVASGRSLSTMISLAELSNSTPEKEELHSLLEQTDWNQSEVARILNVSETTIRRRKIRYNLQQNKPSYL